MIKTYVTIQSITDKAFCHNLSNGVIAEDIPKLMPFNNTGKYIPKEGDKIYMFPEVEIPRFKIKEFCNTHKVSIVKSKEKATVAFSSETLLMSRLLSPNNYRAVPKEIVINNLNKNTLVGDSTYLKLKKDLKESSGDLVLIPHYLFHTLSKTRHAPHDCPWLVDDYEQCVDNFVYISQDKEFIEKVRLYKETSCPVYHKDTLLEILNPIVSMDKDMFTELSKLMESTDPADHSLVIETMGNCDFRNSAAYILLLIHQHRQTMYDCYASKHVNFKALLKYFGISTLSTSFSGNHMLYALAKHGYLSPSNYEILKPYLIKDLEGSIYGTWSYRISDITLDDSLLEALNNNILEPMLREIPVENSERISEENSQFDHTFAPDVPCLS